MVAVSLAAVPSDGLMDRGEAERFTGLLDEHGMTVATDHPAGEHDFDTCKSAVPAVADFVVSGWAATP